MSLDRAAILAKAREAAGAAYAPYSGFAVGAALLFDDGAVITASNVENASYGLSLCAEAVAVAKAMNGGPRGGRRGGLLAIAVAGPSAKPITPCGRCRQMLGELAQLGSTDPLVISADKEWRLSQLLPEAFGPASLGE